MQKNGVNTKAGNFTTKIKFLPGKTPVVQKKRSKMKKES